MSQNGCAHTATPPAPWISSIASSTVGRLALAEGRLALDQIGDQEGGRVQQALGREPLAVLRHRLTTACGEVGAPDRLALGGPLGEHRVVEREAELAQGLGHRLGAVLAV